MKKRLIRKHSGLCIPKAINACDGAEMREEIDSVEESWVKAMQKAVFLSKKGIDTRKLVEKLRNARVMINQCKYDEHAHIEELEYAKLLVEEAKASIEAEFRNIKLTKEDDEKIRKIEEMLKLSTGEKTKAAPKTKNWIRVHASFVPESIVEELRKEEISIEEDGDFLIISGSEEGIKKAKEKIKGNV